MGNSKPEKIRCEICKEKIEYGADKCIHCDSYQGTWRRLLDFSNTILALLVALVSVSGVMIPVIFDACARKDSDVRVRFLSTSSHHDELWLLATNRGTRAAGISKVVLIEGSKQPRNLRLESSRTVPAQATEEIHLFSPDPLLPQFLPYGEGPEACRIEVHVLNHRREDPEVKPIDLPCLSQDPSGQDSTPDQ